MSFDEVRGFDGITPKKGNLRARSGVQYMSTAMWNRILEQIELHPTTYYAINSSSVPRIGYGRRILGSTAEAESSFTVDEEARWLKVTLEDLYNRIIIASPNAPLNEVLASVLHYYNETYA